MTFDISLDLRQDMEGNAADTWVHVALSVGPNAVNIYVDGEPTPRERIGWGVGYWCVNTMQWNLRRPLPIQFVHASMSQVLGDDNIQLTAWCVIHTAIILQVLHRTA
jgi:hypothetical protein